MSQISPPIRIVLVAAIAFMAAWFVFLRPGAEPVTPPPAPASGLGTAVSGANATAAQANAAAATASSQSADPAAATAPATNTGGATAPAGAKPAPAAKAAKSELGLPASVAKAVAKDKALVMLFWNKDAYDDQAVRSELRKIDRHKGKVQVHVASINDVARYAPITRGVNLEQSPTVVVVKGNSADALVGYVDRGAINQTVSDVLRSTAKAKAAAKPAKAKAKK